MLFIVQFEDVYADQPERLPERQRHMPAHLAFMAAQGDKVVAAGALRPTEDAMPLGGIWIVSAESKAAVEAIYQDDPFWKAGLCQATCKTPPVATRGTQPPCVAGERWNA